jgi:hypothetical protein
VIGSACFKYSPVFQSFKGLGAYDLRALQDRIITFDYNSTGYLSALALYRPRNGVFFIEFRYQRADYEHRPVNASNAQDETAGWASLLGFKSRIDFDPARS